MTDGEGVPSADPRIVYEPHRAPRAAIDKLGDLISEALPGLVNEIIHQLGEPIVTNNPTLFHYTTGQRLVEILQSGELWMTSVGYLNDRTEYVHGVKLFVKSISSLRKQEPGVHQTVLDQVLLDLRKFSPNDYFLVSFAQDGDQLSQWRGYAADGYGYAIQFDISQLKESLLDNPGILPYTVLYNRGQQQKFCDRYLSRVLENVPRWLHDARIPATDREIASCAGFCVRMTLGMFKHPGFWEEKEFRLCMNHLVGGPEKIRWSERNGVVRPHFPLLFKSKRLPIKAIVAGPNLDLDRAKWSLNKLLESKGYKGVTIKKSKIPYLASG